MGVTVKYKGPSVHERILTRKDLEAAGVEFPEGVTVKTMVWAPDPRRRGVDITDLGDSARQFFEDQPTFQVVEDGEVASDAHPKAGEVNPDGTNKAETEGDGVDHSVGPQRRKR
jgi:hypothetical protein